jgi:type II secretory pathway component PulK
MIVVLGMIMALSVLLLGFHRKARTHLSTAVRIQQSQQCHNYAYTGLSHAMAIVQSLDTASDGSKKRFGTERKLPVSQGTCTFRLQPLEGRINVNRFKQPNGQLNRPIIDQFLRLIDLVNHDLPLDQRLGYGLVPAIIDWTDNDHEPTILEFIKGKNTGVESAYYQRRDRPTTCSNAPLQACAELLLIRGMSPAAFAVLEEHITVKGDDKINLNYASKQVLRSFSLDMTESLAQAIVDRRQRKPFTSLDDIGTLPGLTDPIRQALSRQATVASTNQYFLVRARGDIGPVHRRIRALVKRNTSAKTVDILEYQEL